ncbi:uncharacterized protein JN550_008977 [Neoarthrinium moseri]|uniref:uncharacterized protein n=1 Tax=Neoarthrinium moseri TaxID=1658444 RepID=UPI001FDCCC0A|nr:uncharacterized protein JN550_008977 [Neoarthrinium moseri]KAI1864420.1 hypothetical protein JN550_008977 [Neoarthrinium moseri]
MVVRCDGSWGAEVAAEGHGPQPRLRAQEQQHAMNALAGADADADWSFSAPVRSMVLAPISSFRSAAADPPGVMAATDCHGLEWAWGLPLGAWESCQLAVLAVLVVLACRWSRKTTRLYLDLVRTLGRYLHHLQQVMVTSCRSELLEYRRHPRPSCT